MMSDPVNFIQTLMIWAIPILFAITAHEVAHGWVASKFGDKTALFMGRLTLNPIKHIDLVGTLIVPAVFLLVGGFIFGWAKPVPVDWRNLRHPRRDMALVAAAGPCANLIMALIWAGIAKLAMVVTVSGFNPAKIFVYMGMAGISINLMLMILNLIPIPPLDGSRVLASILPRRWSIYYEQIERFGLIILVLLIFSGILSSLLRPFYELGQELIMMVFRL